LEKNGIGKSVSLKILSGDIKPNLGEWETPPDWKEIKKTYRGTGLQTHFEALAGEDIESAYKPQQVERLPDIYSGKVRSLLEKSADGDIEEIAEKLDIKKLLDRDIEHLSGGELQRVAIASTLLKDVDLYMFDEPSSFLDVKQRLKAGAQIRKLDETKEVMAVEHDLATLDLISDFILSIFSMESQQAMEWFQTHFQLKKGLTIILTDTFPSFNVRFRGNSISFERTKEK